MPWFKVDDQFWSHPKIATLSSDAISLWVRAGSYAAQHLTDGLIPGPVVTRQLWASADDAGELVECGLWDREGDGYRFHDWLEYQPTAESTIAKRQADRDRKRKQRRNDRGQYADSHKESQGESRRDAARDSDGSRERVAPSPNPNPNPSPNGEDNKPRKRGSRLPDDFSIDDDMRAWAREHLPDLDIDSLLPEFVDYWSAQPGQKGVKTDWIATWRNGMRKQAEWKSRASRQPVRQPAMNRALDEFQRLYGGDEDAGEGRLRALDVGRSA